MSDPHEKPKDDAGVATTKVVAESEAPARPLARHGLEAAAALPLVHRAPLMVGLPFVLVPAPFDAPPTAGASLAPVDVTGGDGCPTCRHHSARKRPRVTDTAGYDAYVEFADDDETVWTCRHPGVARGVLADPRVDGVGGVVPCGFGFTGERLVPLAASACAGYEAGRRGGGAAAAAADEAEARWRARQDRHAKK